MIKPTKEQLISVAGTAMKDIIAPNLSILFCGINPGLYSAASGHHFAKPGNRFWKALFLGGLTDRLLDPFEDQLLLNYKIGITNFVNKATISAAELTTEEYQHGAQVLEQKINQYKPKIVAFLGIGAYRIAFNRPKTILGLQTETIANTQLWVLPNPSGLNAHFQIEQLAELFKELKIATAS